MMRESCPFLLPLLSIFDFNHGEIGRIGEKAWGKKEDGNTEMK